MSLFPESLELHSLKALGILLWSKHERLVSKHPKNFSARRIGGGVLEYTLNLADVTRTDVIWIMALSPESVMEHGKSSR